MLQKLAHAIPPFLDLLALFTAMGVLSCHLWLLPPRGAILCAPHLIQPKLRRLLGAALCVLTITSVGLLAVRAAEMSGRPLLALAPILPTVLFETHYGTIWLIRAFAVVMLWLGWLATQRGSERGAAALLFCLVAVIFWSYSATGHAADRGDFTLEQAVDWVHLLAVSLWTGGILATTLAIRPAILSGFGFSPGAIGKILERLSQLATVALVLVLATGSYNTWLRVATLSGLGETTYGRLLVIKLLFVFSMILLGAVNRFFTLPRVRAWAAGTHPPVPSDIGSRMGERRDARTLKTAVPPGPVRHFLGWLVVEAWLAVGVLAIVAVLINQLPPSHAMHKMPPSMDHSPTHHPG